MEAPTPASSSHRSSAAAAAAATVSSSSAAAAGSTAVCWTNSRQIQLFDAQAQSFDPLVCLDGNTQLAADMARTIKAVQRGNFTLVWVHVLSGTHKGREGYVPRTCVKEYLLRGTPIPDSRLVLSGLSYGGANKVSWLGDKRIIDNRCPACGVRSRLHRVPETEGADNSSKALCTRLVDRMMSVLDPSLKSYANDVGSARKPNAVAKPVLLAQLHGTMVGVLVTRQGTIYAAHSGEEDYEAFGAAAQELGMVWARRVQRDQLVCVASCDPNNPSVGTLRALPQRLSCAAPKLIQAALRAKEVPFAMTESILKPPYPAPDAVKPANANAVREKLVDYGALRARSLADGKPTMDHGHSIESCDQCRALIPYMLCGIEQVASGGQ